MAGETSAPRIYELDNQTPRAEGARVLNGLLPHFFRLSTIDLPRSAAAERWAHKRQNSRIYARKQHAQSRCGRNDSNFVKVICLMRKKR
jgi:hypothetical protein